MTELSAIFADRHIGPRPDEVARMVQLLGYADVDALVDAAVPDSIRSAEPLRLPEPASEVDALTDQNTQTQTRVDSMLASIDYQKTLLTEKFTNMETQLAQMQSILDSIKQTTDAWSQKNN